MQHKRNTLALIELSIFLLIWLVVFISPLVLQSSNGEIDWESVWGNWRRLSPFLLLSLINHFILFPYLFKGKRKPWYILSSTAVLILFSYGLFKLHKPNRAMDLSKPSDPAALHAPPPQNHAPGLRPGGRIEDQMPLQTTSGLPPYLNTALIALLIIGFDTGLRSIFLWTRSEQEKDKLEKEKIKSELAFLRNQVNPHFLMNTLNNIHALVDIDTEKTKDTVIQLSKLMRYLLYDTERDFIPIREEISFIHTYVQLMEMRISKLVDVSLNIQVADENKNIPPLLFTSLIENAFKHGISTQMKTFIKLDLVTSEQDLNFKLSNSIAQKTKAELAYSGIGLENTRKRLDILYGNRYHIDIQNDGETYTIELNIPL